jgi:hypothetical protein
MPTLTFVIGNVCSNPIPGSGGKATSIPVLRMAPKPLRTLLDNKLQGKLHVSGFYRIVFNHETALDCIEVINHHSPIFEGTSYINTIFIDTIFSERRGRA